MKWLYIISIAFGIGFGLFCAPSFLPVWNKHVAYISPNLPVMCVIMAVVGIVAGFFVACKLENRYLAASSGFPYILLSLILIVIAVFLITAIVIIIVSIAVLAIVFGVFLFAVVIYSIFRLFHDDTY